MRASRERMAHGLTGAPHRCWSCNSTHIVNASAGGTLALAIEYEALPFGGDLRLPLQKYGHVWETIEKFYACLLGNNRWPAPRPPARVVLPGAVSHVKGSIFHELQTLFHGDQLAIERLVDEDALPVCTSRSCCPVSRESTARFGKVAQLHVNFFDAFQHYPLPVFGAVRQSEGPLAHNIRTTSALGVPRRWTEAPLKTCSACRSIGHDHLGCGRRSGAADDWHFSCYIVLCSLYSAACSALGSARQQRSRQMRAAQHAAQRSGMSYVIACR